MNGVEVTLSLHCSSRESILYCSLMFTVEWQWLCIQSIAISWILSAPVTHYMGTGEEEENIRGDGVTKEWETGTDRGANISEHTLPALCKCWFTQMRCFIWVNSSTVHKELKPENKSYEKSYRNPSLSCIMGNVGSSFSGARPIKVRLAQYFLRNTGSQRSLKVYSGHKGYLTAKPG